MKSNHLSLALLVFACAVSTKVGLTEEGRAVFYLPLDGDLVARTTEAQVEPSAGVVLLEDISQSVTIGEIAEGKQIRLGGETLGAQGDSRIRFVPGLSGRKAARLQTMLSYPAPWLKDQKQGTIALWYKNPHWRILTWRVPAMLTTAQTYRAKPSAFQTPLSHWIFDRLTSPPEQGKSKWFHWYLDYFTEHPRNMVPREKDDNLWHFWALRWDREKKLLEVIDDDQARDISKYDSLVKPGEDHWIEEYRGHVSKVYEDVGHIKFDEIFLGQLHLARYCHVTLDEVYVWDRAMEREELLAAWRRGRAGEEVWPKEVRPVPKRRLDKALDLTRLPRERPPLPDAVQWGDQGAHVEKTSTMVSTGLNGYWRVQPVAGRLVEPKPETWFYARLPGPLSGTDRKALAFDTKFKPLGTVEVEGRKGRKSRLQAWNGRPISSFSAFWLERDLDVPASQKGGRFILRYDRYDPAKTIFDVYINGRHVRRCRSYGPDDVDITDWIRPGESNRVALMLTGKTHMFFDLYLDAQSLRALSVHDVYVVPEYRKKAVAVRCEVKNHTDEPQTCSFGASFAEWKTGKKAHSIPATEITLKPGESRKVSLRGNWEKPHCWSIYDPFLYTGQVVLKVKAATVHESLPVRFGYREIWAEDGWLVVNGSKLHVRGLGQGFGILGYTRVADDADMHNRTFWYIASQKKWGQWWKRGVNKYHASQFLKLADEMGCFATIRISGTGFQKQRLWAGNPEQQASSLGLMKWVRNHPSLGSFIIRQTPDYSYAQIGEYERKGIAASGNLLMGDFGWWDAFEQKAMWQVYTRRWDEYVEPFRRSYPTFFCMGLWSPYGNVMGSTFGKLGYGAALQSREEIAGKLSRRVVNLNAECGWPQISRNAFDASGRDDLSTYYKRFWANLSTLYEETAAIYFGDDAYDQEAVTEFGFSPLMKKKEDGTARFDRDYVKAIETVGRPFTRKSSLNESPAYVRLRMLCPRRLIAAWRWFGAGYWEHTESSFYFRAYPSEDEIEKVSVDVTRLPGLYSAGSYQKQLHTNPESYAKGIKASMVGKEVAKAQAPLVAWIYGWPDVLRKDHAYFSGEIIRKQIGIISEYPWPIKAAVRWKITDLDENSVIASGEIAAAFATGDQQLHPLEMVAPPAADKRRFRIGIETVLDGKSVHDDRFDFQVFPDASADGISGSIAVIETSRTEHLLKAAGLAYTPVKEETDLSKFELLIIGSLTDQDRVHRLLKKLAIKKHLANGLNVLIFAQEPDILRRPDPSPWPVLTFHERPDRPELVSYGLKMERRSARYVFIRDKGHPLFEGLDNEDMANWRGASSLIPPWKAERWYGSIGKSRNWRDPNMSNLGDVATYVFDKPQGGNFVSLLDTQFDLLHFALLEERRSRGRTIYCQLNLAERYRSDPVATLLANRLLRYALEGTEGPSGRAAFLGGKPWRRALENLPFDLPDLKDGADSLKGLSALVVGIGTPRIEDFDESNKFVGIEAAPAAPGKDPALGWLTQNKDAVASFVAQGGTVLVLPVRELSELSWLPFAVKLKQVKFSAAKPNGFFTTARTIGPADLYYRRAVEMFVPDGLPAGATTTAPAVLARVPWQKGEFHFSQLHPKRFYGNWSESKIVRLLSAILTEKGIADRLDLDLTQHGYGEKGYPYFAQTLYFDPYLSTSW